MAEIIKERERVWYKNMEHSFLWKDDPTGGFSFPVNDDGSYAKLTDVGQENLNYCLNNPDKFIDEGIKDNGWYVMEPAKAICECGKKIDLINQYQGAGECPYCNRWHNLFGQLLKNPDEWEKII